jgi:hypothetical protein
MKKYVTIFIVVFLAFSIFSQSLFDITSIEQGTERLKAYEELVRNQSFQYYKNKKLLF